MKDNTMTNLNEDTQPNVVGEPDYDTMCKCGHTLEDHHMTWFKGGGMWAEECEAFGSNEWGGLDEYGAEHCRIFKRADNERT